MPTTFSPGATSAKTVVRLRDLKLLREKLPIAHATKRPAAAKVDALE